MAFNSTIYRAAYATVDNQITNGLPAPNGVVYTNALDYYNGYGKTVPSLEGFFTGSKGNDTVTGSGAEVNGNGGVDVDLYGIDFTITDVTPTSVRITPKSLGIGEIDTLVGRTDPNLEDGFFLSALNGTFTTRNGLNNPVSGGTQGLYVGRGDRDFGRIQNFNSNKDYVSLSGAVNSFNYLYEGNGDFKIYKQTGRGKGDLVGIVESGADGPFDLQARRFLADNSFRLSGRVVGRGFNENLYLELNNLGGAVNSANALSDYVSTGQFNKKIGIFTGAAKGSPVSASSTPADGNDTIFSYGRNNKTILSGVSLSVGPDGNVAVESGFGDDQKDVLIGSFNTKDEFWLGIGNDLVGAAQSFYKENTPRESAFDDFATIQNYQKQDRVILAGAVNDYSYASIGSTIQISTTGGDLIGIVENVTGIDSTKAFSNGTFSIGFSV
jgi:hypothetical protein